MLIRAPTTSTTFLWLTEIQKLQIRRTKSAQRSGKGTSCQLIFIHSQRYLSVKTLHYVLLNALWVRSVNYCLRVTSSKKKKKGLSISLRLLQGQKSSSECMSSKEMSWWSQVLTMQAVLNWNLDYLLEGPWEAAWHNKIYLHVNIQNKYWRNTLEKKRLHRLKPNRLMMIFCILWLICMLPSL